jgi:hypothetical protein
MMEKKSENGLQRRMSDWLIWLKHTKEKIGKRLLRALKGGQMFNVFIDGRKYLTQI